MKLTPWLMSRVCFWATVAAMLVAAAMAAPNFAIGFGLGISWTGICVLLIEWSARRFGGGK